MKKFAILTFAAVVALTGSAAAQSIQAVPPGARPPVATPSAPGQPAAAPHVPQHTKTEVERKGRTDSDVFLGTYLTLDRECKVGASPRIEFPVAPKSGKMRTRNHPINLRDVPGAPRRTCIGTSPNGVAVIYRSDRRFKGEEMITFKVVYPNGDTREVAAKVVIQ